MRSWGRQRSWMCEERIQGPRLRCGARPAVAELLQGHPGIDEILVYEYRGKHRGVLGKLALIRALRGRNFHLAILFQNAFEAALLTFLAGVVERVGYATDGRTWLLSQPIKAPIKKGAVHQVQNFRGLIPDVTGGQTDGKTKLSRREGRE